VLAIITAALEMGEEGEGEGGEREGEEGGETEEKTPV